MLATGTDVQSKRRICTKANDDDSQTMEHIMQDITQCETPK